MEKWENKVAVVTGASAGIGRAIARALVHQGMTVVGLARREDKIQELSKDLVNERGKLIAIKTDLRKEDDILAAFSRIESEFGGVDVLVNNAGVADTERFLDCDVDKWREILEVNVLALCICSKEYLQSAKRRNLEQGHIININSVLGHMVNSGKAAMYQASKHAVTAICKSLRKGLADEDSTIKVTSISPGFTHTEIMQGTSAETRLSKCHMLESSDVAEAVITVLSSSSVSQICEIILTPVPFKKLVY